MKFSIDSKEFKNITERAAVVCCKKGISSLTSILIIADAENQRVTIKATNLESYAEVFTDDVRVAESGNVFVEVDNLKRLYNVVGEIEVATTEKSIKVKSSKKQSEVYVGDNDEIAFPSVTSDVAFMADKEDMIETFSKVACCLSVDDTRPILTGFNVATISGDNRIATCDGYRIAMRKVEWNFRDGLNITIPGKIVKELSKASSNKQTENLNVFADDKYVKFVGTDFAYTCRLLDGQYFDVDSVMDVGYSTYGFEIKAENLLTIAKEYGSFLKGTQIPMYVCYINGKIVTAAMNRDYKTSDVLEVENERNIPENLRYALNPMFLKDAMTIFEKQNITVESDLNGKFASWKFVGNNGYSALILPVRPREDLSDIEEFVASA